MKKQFVALEEAITTSSDKNLVEHRLKELGEAIEADAKRARNQRWEKVLSGVLIGSGTILVTATAALMVDQVRTARVVNKEIRRNPSEFLKNLKKIA